MKVNILTLNGSQLPQTLRLVDASIKRLYITGAPLNEIVSHPRVAIVGSRKATAYGRAVTFDLATKLSRAGVVIISGLAFGIDSYAHRATLAAGGCAVAVLPTPLTRISPAAHYSLAAEILKRGGALISEYGPEDEIYKVNFVARNRIVSALADVLLITEAARNSGSLHTARFALEQGKTVMAVPGNIDSPTSEGCNNLIKSGAVPVTDVSDIFFALGINPRSSQTRLTFHGTPEQKRLFELIAEGAKQQEQLAALSQLSIPQISSALTDLELQGYIRPAGGGVWTIA